MIEWYRLEGKVPVKCDEPGRWERSDRRVDYDEVGQWRISTVFLGLDHNFDDAGPPLLFETMILGADGSDHHCERTATWEDALEAHHRAIVIADGLPDDPQPDEA